MKMKKAILSCLMLMGVLSASAQEQKGTTEYIFEPHWYIQLQGGAQYTVGETTFGKLISPTVQGAVGYNFNKNFGARLALNAWQGKGGYKEEVGTDLNYKFTYFAPAIDLTANLSNMIAGINPNRKIDFGAFIGIGLNFRSKAKDEANNVKATVDNIAKYSENAWTPMPSDYMDAATLFFGSVGLTADYRITDQFSIGLELNANILGDKYNHKKAGNPDSYFNALLGLKYAFGPTYSTRFIPDPEPEIKYVEKIVEKIVEAPCPEPAVEPIRRDIFFLINKFNIRETEEQKVRDIVDYMRANPASKVQVTGYADAGTGNDKINDRLAAQRADAVVKMLQDKYGIPADRISSDSKGARVQPFADNDSNRVSICIAE
ncbi:MAG: OmpA family protein [Prevotella sp.]|jgi:outer membrane protein OmpA-like peptidoglycan-associated protein|nr:OmpA family protein [Prevotella sp.]